MKRGTRKLHTRVGLLGGAPFFIVTISAILFVHGAVIGLQKVKINASWLPGYALDARRPMQVNSMLVLGDKKYLGTESGVFVVVGNGKPERQIPGAVVINLVAVDSGAVMAITTKGIWRSAGEKWQMLLKGDIINATVSHDGRIAAHTKRRGMLTSTDDGKTWTRFALAKLPRAPREASVVRLKEIMLDLHTGEALLGNRYKFLWTDLLGISLAIMVASGLWGWSSTRRSREAARRLAAERSAAD